MSEISSPTCNVVGGSGFAVRALDRVRRVWSALTSRGDRAVDGRNAMVAFAVRVASAAILFLSQVLLARWMGAAEYGTYVYAWTVVLVLGGMATVGLNIGAIRIVSQLRETAALAELRGFLRASRLLVLTVGCAVAATAIHVANNSAAVPPAGPWSVLAIILLAVPAYALTDMQDGISRGWARITSALVAPYILRPLFILAGLAGMMLAGVHLGAAEAALAAVAATWAAWACQTFALSRDARTLAGNGERQYRARHWVLTTTPLFAMSICDLAMQNIDVIAISNLLSPAEAGIYFAAAKTMSLILFVHYAVGSALANRFSALATRGDRDGMREAARDGVRWTFWPSLLLAAVMLGSGPWLLALFGPRFTDGLPVMAILAVAILVRASIGPAETLLSMTGGQRDCARSLMIAALTNLIGCILLVPRFGILGAAASVSTAMMLGALLNWRAVRRNLGIDPGIWARRSH